MNRRAVFAFPLILGALPAMAADDADFFRAARNGDLSTLERLLTSGQPVDTRDANGRTALLGRDACQCR